MNETNPEIEANLDAIATICCAAISGDANAELNRVDGLLKSLLMSGYSRSANRSFEVDLETLVKEKCGEKVSHRGGELSALSAKFASQFAALARQQSKSPTDHVPPKAANISAATKA